MDAKKSTRNQGAENGTAAAAKDENQAGDPVDILRADQQALCAALKELGGSEPSAGSGQVYDICRQHIAIIDQVVVPAMKKAGVAEDRLQEVLVWHDLLKLLLAELTVDQTAVQEYRAKQVVFTHLMNKLLKQEEDAGTGIFALLASAKPDLTDIAGTIRDRKAGATEQAETQQRNGLGLSILRLDMLSRPQHFPTEDDPMERNQYERHRDDEGRFTSSRSGRYGRDDDYRSEGRGGNSGSGWYGDSRGHAEAARLGWERRDDHRGGGYRDDEDDDRHYSRGRQGSGNDRPRDSQGRFMSDEDDDRHYRGGRNGGHGYGNGGNGNGGPPRDEYGRFTSDDDDHRRGSSGGYSYRERQEDDRHSGRGFYDDNDRRYSSSSRGRGGRDDYGDDRGRGSDDRGHGGWFGDSRGHAEAARRGWEDRRR